MSKPCNCTDKNKNTKGMTGRGECWHIHVNHIKYANSDDSNTEGLYFSFKGGKSYYEVYAGVSKNPTVYTAYEDKPDGGKKKVEKICRAYKACMAEIEKEKDSKWFAATQEWRQNGEEVSVNVENLLKKIRINNNNNILCDLETLHTEFSNKYGVFYTNDFNESYEAIRNTFIDEFTKRYNDLYEEVEEIRCKEDTDQNVIQGLRARYDNLNSIRGFNIEWINTSLDSFFEEQAEVQRQAADAEAERQAAIEAQRQAAAEAQRQAAAAVEAQRLETERLAAEEAQRLEAEEAERQRLEAQRLAAEEAERQRLEAERLAAEEAERQRLEAQRLAAEEAERQRLEAQRLAAEAQRLETERLAAEEAQRLAAAASKGYLERFKELVQEYREIVRQYTGL